MSKKLVFVGMIAVLLTVLVGCGEKSNAQKAADKTAEAADKAAGVVDKVVKGAKDLTK